MRGCKCVLACVHVCTQGRPFKTPGQDHLGYLVYTNGIPGCKCILVPVLWLSTPARTCIRACMCVCVCVCERSLGAEQSRARDHGQMRKDMHKEVRGAGSRMKGKR